MKTLLVIDPGVSGALVRHHLAVRPLSDIRLVLPFTSFEEMRPSLVGLDTPVALIEEVHASPIQSQSSAFKFGQNFGEWIGFLRGLEIPVYGVRPQQWQFDLNLKSKGDQRKRDLRLLAKKLHPNLRVTAETCDAILMADYALKNINASGTIGGKRIA